MAEEKGQNKLKRALGFWDCMGIGVGQIIGAGIMILTGISIELTGAGTPIAFIIACVVVLCPSFVMATMGAAIPSTGGMYVYVRDYIGQKTAFLYLVLFVCGQLVLAMFAITFAQYTVELVPAWNATAVAFIILTVCFAVNVIGLSMAAKFQNAMVVVLLVALIVFIIWGMPKVDYSVFAATADNPHPFMPNGIIAFMTAVSLLTFATSGASFLSELGGEMKDAGRILPRAILASTAIVGVFYTFMGIVAVGVLPIPEVAGQTLVKVAAAVLPQPLYVFFIIGGGMFAVATTLNGSFTWCTKSLLVAAREGWLPKGLSSVSRFGTPWIILTIFYIIGAIPILTGWSIRTIAMLGNGVSLIFFLFPLAAALLIHKKNPVAMEKSVFKVSRTTLITIGIIAIGTSALCAWLNISDITNSWIMIVIIGVAAVAYAHWRQWYMAKKGTPIVAIKEEALSDTYGR